MALSARYAKGSDTFDSSIGSNWANGPGDWDTMVWVTGGYVRDSNPGLSDSCMRWIGTTVGANQYARTTINSLALGAGTYASVHATVRLQSSTDEACYFGQLRTASGKYAIYEVDNTFGVVLLASTGTAPTSYTAGDYMVMEAQWTGSTNNLELYTSEGGGPETSRLTWSDATLQGGQPGCGANSDTGTIQITAWEGGDDIAPFSFEQEGFRFGADDGSESAHTWSAAQDTGITAPASQTRVVAVLVNVTGAPAATVFKLQYRRVGETLWRDVPVQ